MANAPQKNEHRSEAHAALVLQQIDGLASADVLNLYQLRGSFSASLAVDRTSLPDAFPRKAFQGLYAYQQSPASLDQVARSIIDQCEEESIQLLPMGSELYPSLLQEISRPPLLLFARGDAGLLSLPQVAIVGSRHASASGIQNAREFARVLGGSGFVVTSGLALGIDGAAHQGAQQAGKTIAVVGTGVDVVYPRSHRGLHQEILDKGGVIVSEFFPGTPPLAHNFPGRNRVISGLSLGVLVIEAAIKSGSLITARYAAEQGREVFAIPGSIHSAASKGCHQLLKQGATLVETAADIVEQLGGMLSYLEESKASPVSDTFTPEERQLLDVMGFDPVDVDSLVARTGWAISTLNQQLSVLELKGVIASSGGRFTRLY